MFERLQQIGSLTYSAAQHEFTFFKKYFNNLPATRFFSRLITPEQPREITAAPVISDQLSRRLEVIADGRFNELPDDLDDIEEDSDPRSLLRSAETGPATATELDLTAGREKISESSALRHPRILRELPDDYRSVIARYTAIFEGVSTRQSEIEAIAAEGIESYETAQPKLIAKAEEWSREVGELENGESLHFYFPLSGGKHSILNSSIEQLGGYLAPGKERYTLESIRQKVRVELQNALNNFNLGTTYTQVIGIFESLRTKMLGENPSYARMAVVESISEDFSTLLRDRMTDMRIPEGIVESLGAMPAELETKLDDILRTVFRTLDEQVMNLGQIVQPLIPEVMQEALAEKQIQIAKQFAYMIVERVGADFTVTVYPSKKDPSFYVSNDRGFHSPLVYKEVKAAQLPPEFFYRALTYQAFLEKQGVNSFSLVHFREGLLDRFFRPPVEKEGCIDRNFNDQSLGAFQYTLMTEAIVAATSCTKNNFDRVIKRVIFEDRFACFLQGWNYFHHHADTHLNKSRVQMMKGWVQTLAKEVQRLRQDTLFTQGQLDIWYVTLCEAAKKLQKLQQRLESQPMPPPSLMIPPEMRQRVEEICGTDSAVSAVEILRSLFVEVLGDEVDPALEHVIQELLPRGNPRVPTAAAPEHTLLHRLGFKSVLGKEEIDGIGVRAGQFKERPSLLTTYRVYSALCQFCNDAVVGTLVELVVKALLVVFFPGVITSSFILKSLLDRAARYGQGALSSVLPQHIADGVFAFLSLYNEVTSYIKKRVAMLVMRSAFRTVLNEHRENIVRQIEQFGSQVTREGTIGYRLGSAPEVVEVSSVTEPEPVISVAGSSSIAETSQPHATEEPLTEVMNKLVSENPIKDLFPGLFVFDAKLQDTYLLYFNGKMHDVHLSQMLRDLWKLEEDYKKLENYIAAKEYDPLYPAVPYLMIACHRLFFMTYTIARNCLEINPDTKELTTLLPAPNVETFKYWTSAISFANTQIEEYAESYLSFFHSGVSRKAPIWSKKRILELASGDALPSKHSHIFFYFLDQTKKSLQDLNLTESTIDKVINEMYGMVDVSAHLASTRIPASPMFRQRAIALLCRSCLMIENLNNQYQSKPVYALDTSFLTKRVDTEFFSRTFPRTSMQALTAQYRILKKAIEQQCALGVVNPELFISYFRIKIQAYHHAVDYLRERIPTLVYRLPRPNIPFLKEWWKVQEVNLTPAQNQEIAALIGSCYYDSDAMVWSSPEVVQRCDWSSIFQVVNNDLPDPHKRENFWSGMGFDEMFLTKIEENLESFPVPLYVRIGLLGDYLYTSHRRQMPEAIQLGGECFWANIELTTENIELHLRELLRSIECDYERFGIERSASRKKFKRTELSDHSAYMWVVATQFVRMLPIPYSSLKANAFWDEVLPLRMIGLLHDLHKLFRQYTPDIENTVSLYTLYTISYYLLKRLYKDHEFLKGIMPSGMEFITFMATGREYLMGMNSASTMKQAVSLLNVFHGFGLDNLGVYDGKRSRRKMVHQIATITKNTTRMAIRHPSNIDTAKEEGGFYAYSNLEQIDRNTFALYSQIEMTQKNVTELYSQIGFETVTVPEIPIENSRNTLEALSRLHQSTKFVYNIATSMFRKNSVGAERSANSQIDYAVVDLFMNKRDRRNRSILPKEIDHLREMEYGALICFRHSFGRLNLTGSLAPFVYPLSSKIRDGTLDMHRAGGGLSDVIDVVTSFRTFKFDADTMYPTATFDNPPAYYVNGKIDDQRWEEDTPILRRKRSEAFKYRGEELLRTLQLIRDSKGSFLKEISPADFFSNYMSAYLILESNPNIFSKILYTILDIIDQGGVKAHRNSFARMLMRLSKMAFALRTEENPMIDLIGFVRHRIRERLKTGVLDDWNVLIESYLDDVRVFEYSKVVLDRAVLDVARGFVKEIPLNGKGPLPFHAASLTLSYWKSFVIDKFQADPMLIENFMLEVFSGYVELEDLIGDWRGVYPVYTNGRLTVNVDLLVKNYRTGKFFYDVEKFFPLDQKPIVQDAEEEVVSKEAPKIEGDEVLRRVDLNGAAHSLSLLSWFQPLEDVVVYVRPSSTDEVAKIEFSRFPNLVFRTAKVGEETRAYCEGQFPGFYISEKQNQKELLPFAQSLLLQNEDGERKILLAPLSMGQLAAAMIAKMGLDYSVTSGIMRWIPQFGEAEAHLVSGTLTEDGKLIPDTPEAIAYLMVFSYTQGNLEECGRYLEELEQLGKRGALPESVWSYIPLMLFPALVGTTKEINCLGCRLSTLLYENDLLYFNAEAILERPQSMRITLWLMAQKCYLALKNGGHKLPIHEFSELNLLKGLTIDASALVKGKIPSDVKKILKKTGATKFIGGMLLHPLLTKRLAKLKAKYLEENQASIQYMVAALMTDKTEYQRFQIPILGAVGGSVAEESGAGFVMNALDIIRTVRKYSLDAGNTEFMEALIKAVLGFNLENDLHAAPVLFFEIKPEDIQKYFVTYLFLLLRVCPGESEAIKTLFEQKSQDFRRHFLLMSGHYREDLRPFVDMLTLVQRDRYMLDNFSFTLPKVVKKGFIPLSRQVVLLQEIYGKSDEERLKKELSAELAKFVRVFQSQAKTEAIRGVLKSRGVLSIGKKLLQETAKSFVPIGKQLFVLNRAIDLACSWPKISKQLDRVHKIRTQHELVPVDLRSDDSLIPDEWAADMAARDNAISAIFDYLLNQYFEVSLEDDSDEEDTTPIALKDESIAGVAFEELYESFVAYHQRPVETPPQISLKGDPEKLKQELEEIRSVTARRIVAERKKIVGFANASGRAAAQNPTTFDDHFKDHEDVSFDEIFGHILRGEDDILMQKTGLSPEWLEQLKLLVHLHMVGGSRWEALFQSAEQAFKKGKIEEIGKALHVRRAYRFARKQTRILLGFLAFETKSGKVLWKKQALMFEKLLTGKYTKQVIELIMGSGKTAFGMPLINYYGSDKAHFVINIWPRPTAKTNIEEISRGMKEIYGQNSFAFSFGRNPKISVKTLEGIYLTLKRALKYAEPINMTKEDLQAIELNFIDLLNTADKKNRKQLKKIHLYAKILKFIFTYAKGNIDEAHINFRYDIDLQFSIGAAKTVEKPLRRTMEKVFHWLIDLDPPELIPFRVVDAVLHKIPEDYFKHMISPQLYPRALREFEIPLEHAEEVIQFFRDEIPAPECVVNHPSFEEICLVKGMFNTYLPHAFDASPFVSYALSKKEKNPIAHPAEANDKPNEESHSESPYEAYVNTCVIYLKRRMTEIEIFDYIEWLQERARKVAEKWNIPIESTTIAKEFFHFSGGRSLFAKDLYGDKNLIERLRDHNGFVLSYVRRLVSEQIKYYGEKSYSNSHTFAAMLSKYTSCTGSRDNHETYPEGTRLLLDPGTQGESVAMIRRKCGTAPIPILCAQSSLGLLDETMDRFFQTGSGYCCIIDRGAIYRGLSTERVAARILEFVNEYRSDIKGVVFWDVDNNLVVLTRNSNRLVPFKQCRLKLEERITYFDQSHTDAADVKQPEDGKGVVTFGELTDLTGFQGPWRMRGLKEEQSFTFTTTETVRRIIGLDEVTPDDVIEYFVRNTEPHREKENYESAFKAMTAVPRSVLLQRIINCNAPIEMIDIFQKGKRLFIEIVHDRPSALFAGATRRGPAREALKIYRERLNAGLPTGLFTEQQLVDIDARLGIAMTGNFPKEVTISLKDGVHRTGVGLRMQTHIDVEAEEQVEEQQERMEETEQQVFCLGTSTENVERWYWPKDLNLYALTDWLKLNAELDVPLHRVRDLCEGDLEVLSRVIPQNLLATNNFAPILNRARRSTGVKPFVSDHPPAYQILFCHSNEQQTFLLIDQKEANFLRPRIRNLGVASVKEPNERAGRSGFAIYDTGFDAPVINSCGIMLDPTIYETPEFNECIALVKFLNGDTRMRDVEIEALGRVFKSANKKRVKDAFMKIIKAREGSGWPKLFYGSKLHEFLVNER